MKYRILMGGTIGVPITILDNVDNRFEIMNANDFILDNNIKPKTTMLIKDKEASINGVIKYVRVIIRRKV